MKLPRLSVLATRLLIALLVMITSFAVLYVVYHPRLAAVEKISAADARVLLPHRALYNLELQKVKQGSTVNNVAGRMLFVWNDVCDAWTIEQRLDLGFQYEGGSNQRIKTSLVTWEAKNNSSFSFNTRREADGAPTEIYRGRATLETDGTGGQAVFQLPAVAGVELGGQTLFPSTHTLHLLKAARAGQRQLTRTVFDGADSVGYNQISAFIGDKQDIVVPVGMVASDKMDQLVQAWPVRLAFFAPDNTSDTPDYEMTMTLLENGVATNLTIDYGDFIVEATLDTLEPLPKPDC